MRPGEVVEGNAGDLCGAPQRACTGLAARAPGFETGDALFVVVRVEQEVVEHGEGRGRAGIALDGRGQLRVRPFDVALGEGELGDAEVERGREPTRYTALDQDTRVVGGALQITCELGGEHVLLAQEGVLGAQGEGLLEGGDGACGVPELHEPESCALPPQGRRAGGGVRGVVEARHREGARALAHVLAAGTRPEQEGPPLDRLDHLGDAFVTAREALELVEEAQASGGQAGRLSHRRQGTLDVAGRLPCARHLHQQHPTQYRVLDLGGALRDRLLGGRHVAGGEGDALGGEGGGEGGRVGGEGFGEQAPGLVGLLVAVLGQGRPVDDGGGGLLRVACRSGLGLVEPGQVLERAAAFEDAHQRVQWRAEAGVQVVGGQVFLDRERLVAALLFEQMPHLVTQGCLAGPVRARLDLHPQRGDTLFDRFAGVSSRRCSGGGRRVGHRPEVSEIRGTSPLELRPAL